MKIPETILIETIHQPGSLARVPQVIAEAGLVIEHLHSLRREQGRTLWEITLEKTVHEKVAAAVRAAAGPPYIV